MKKYLFLLLISVLAIASCSKEDFHSVQVQEKNGIAIDVICSKMSPITKAGISGVKPGEDPYNENAIKTIDYFLYRYDKTDENALRHAKVSVSATDSATINVSIDEAALNTLFPRPMDSCYVAVLVNYPQTINDSNSSLDTIKNLKLSGDFPESVIQSQFVMFGEGVVRDINRKANLIANPTVNVHRVASKITLDAHIAESTILKYKLVDNTGEYILDQTWEPIIEEMAIYLVNGNRIAVVSGDTVASKPYQFYNYASRPFVPDIMVEHEIVRKTYIEDPNSEDPEHPDLIVNGTVKDTLPFFTSYPFYSYPQSWKTGAKEEPYLKLVLPWRRLKGEDDKGHSWGETQKAFYYRIMLPHNQGGFVSNNWYHINLDVSILGSENDDDRVEIDGVYYVVGWGDSTPVGADVKGARYLSVAQTDHKMYNTNELKIPYVTSNKCKIASVVVTQERFTPSSGTDPYTYTFTNSEINGWVTLDTANNVVINHTLINDITKTNFDYSPYNFTIVLQHEDDSRYSKEITVIQYPGMYIEAKASNKYVFINKNDNDFNNQYISVYDDRGSRNGTYMGALLGRGTAMSVGQNANPNLYTIHVTVLPDNYAYSIGDPRDPTGYSSTNSSSPVYMLDTLKNCKIAANNTKDIIAPIFKVASSYGQTLPLTYEGAVKRCAAYKESGYPAGRWRLPTEAEILYMMTLSEKGKIPPLFSPTAATWRDDGSGYWAAGQSFLIKKSDNTLDFETNTSNYDVYARCVYDVWYWGDTQSAQYTWGGYQTSEP